MIKSFEDRHPELEGVAFVAESALVLGDVIVGCDSSIWYQAVVRGDVNRIRIGQRTNIQDRCVVHVSARHPASIGDEVTLGHGAMVHGCTIGDQVLVGMGAVVLDDVEVGDGCVVAAGSLLPPGARFPAGSMIVGSPARLVRPVSPEETQWIAQTAQGLVQLARRHAALTDGCATC